MKAKYDEYTFAGGNVIPSSNIGIPVLDQGPIGPSGENLVWFRQNKSKAYYGPNDGEGSPTFVYFLDSNNYDGLRRINARVATSTIEIFAKYVALSTMDGTARVGFKSPFPHDFVGFKVHASEPADPGNLDVIIYSAKGAAWDYLAFSQDMQGISDIHNMFETPIFLAPDDRIDLTWDKEYGIDWGISLYVRKL